MSERSLRQSFQAIIAAVAAADENEIDWCWLCGEDRWWEGIGKCADVFLTDLKRVDMSVSYPWWRSFRNREQEAEAQR